jgi:hypothetical protein
LPFSAPVIEGLYSNAIFVPRFLQAKVHSDLPPLALIDNHDYRKGALRFNLRQIVVDG